MRSPEFDLSLHDLASVTHYAKRVELLLVQKETRLLLAVTAS
jgi:hypothetical protein